VTQPAQHTTEQRLSAAARYLRLALDNDATADARRGYQLVGLALAELPDPGMAGFPALIRDRLGRLLTSDPVLAARAAADIASPAQDDGDVRASLLARSGYQVLLDAGVWTQPPLSDFHLAEVDEGLAEALALHGAPQVPEGIPASHTWWRRP
jgi:hypothetical protein